MRFSDIQDDPLDYDYDVLFNKIKNYFTVDVSDYKFINYLKTNNLIVTTSIETAQPVDLHIYILNNEAYLPGPDLSHLWDVTRFNIDETRFSNDFLQKLMCETASNKPFQNQLQNTIANIALENISNCTSSELNDMFSEYFEDSLDNFSIGYNLYFRYTFTSSRSIKVYTPKDEFELIKSDLTDHWMLNDELSEHLIEKFQEDCTEIKNLILNQPTELRLALNEPLPKQLVPYIDNITDIAVTLEANKYGPKWIIDNNYVNVEEDDDYYLYRGTRYNLKIDVPMHLEYDDKNLTVVVFPVKQGQSLKPINKAMDMLQNYTYYWGSIKETLIYLYTKGLIKQELAPKRDLVRQLIFSSNDKTICFKEDDVFYKLRIQQEKAVYYQNNNTQITFIKNGNDFDISLEFSDLRRTKIEDLRETIYELINKF